MSSAVTPPPRNRPRRVSRSSSPRPFVVTSTRSSSTRRVSASRSRASRDVRDDDRLVEPQAEQQALSSTRRGVDRLELARRRGAGRERLDVPRQAWKVPAPDAGQRGDGSDPDAEVVVSVPVAEVVPRAKIASTRTTTLEAEVRGLVPAVAGRAERVDDLLEVALHRVGLTHELVAMRVREARPGLRLELVARQVLRFQCEGFGQIGVEIGGALAGNAVDEIERDVVESGITESVHRPADVVRGRLPLERLEQMRPGTTVRRARRESHPRHERRARTSGVTVSGFASTVSSLADGKAREQPLELGELRERRRPAAEKHRLDVVCQHVALLLELGEQRIDVGAVLPGSPDHRDEVAVPAAMRAERQVNVEMADRAHYERFRSESRFSTARNASCGTSTPPTCFIRFLPFFCFSRSLRLREMSPP